MRKLYRSRDERMIAGVAGGIAQYLGIDPTLVRIAFVAATLFGGWGLLAYIALAIIMPLEPMPGTIESERRMQEHVGAAEETRRQLQEEQVPETTIRR